MRLQKRLQLRLVLLTSLLAVTPAFAELPALSVAPSLSDRARNAVVRIIGELATACPKLFVDYAADIDSMSASFEREVLNFGNGPECVSYRCKDFGWVRNLYLQVRLKDKTHRVPRHYRAWGKTLHFWLGAGIHPGAAVGTFPEWCGVPADKPDGAAFLPIAILDQESVLR